MAATTSGALKAYLEGQGLGLPVFRDRAPNGQAHPFITVREGVSVTVDRTGDHGDPAADTLIAELVQVDLWQARRLPDGTAGEQYTLAGQIAKLLRMSRLVPVGTSTVYGVAGISSVRLDDPDPNVVHHAFTCTVRRQA